ncbi:MAG TPA: zinc ribbon domain-containing protein [Gaiellaceae bacterium]
MTTPTATERETALAAAEETCPRCGTPREPDQRYCLECGLALPQVDGRIASLRRRWITRVGWYPGDWVWVSLLTLVVAIAGAATAILVTHKANAQGPVFTAAPSVSISVQEPTVAPPTATTPATVDTSTLPSAPEPGTTTKKPTAKKPQNGTLAWPNANGWTIVLVSYPKTTGVTAAHTTASRAAKSGLHQVGVLDSSRYASLQPGYFVVFTGIYSSKTDADAAVATARQAGFAGAYSRQIAR